MEVVYIVYRTRKKKGEQFYGWNDNKSVIKAFLKQRSKNKYFMIKVDKDDVEYEAPTEHGELQPEYMIDFIKLKSVKSNETFYIFTTKNELKEYEINTHNMFREIMSLEKIDNNRISDYVILLLNLREEYTNVLHYLGYRPPELDSLFESAIGEDIMYDTISYAYEQMPCEEYYLHRSTPPGLSVLEDVSDKILYSVESFIKVMKEDF